MKNLYLLPLLGILTMPVCAKTGTPAAPVGKTNIQDLAITSPTKHAPAKVEAQSDKKLTRDEILGTYIWDEFRYSTGHVGWEQMYCIPEIIAGEQPDEVIIEGFWADYDTSYYPPVPISRVPAKFDYDNQTLSIKAGTSLGTFGDYPAYIYVSDWNTDIMQPDDIVLNIDAATRCISYWCPRVNDDWNQPISCLLVTSYPDAVGQKITKGVDFIGAIVMNKYNQIMTLQQNGTASAGYAPIYTEDHGNSFTVYNFGNYGYEIGVQFTPDIESGTLTGARTLVYEDYAISASETGNLWIAATDGGDIAGTITRTTGNDTYHVEIPSWSLYNATAGTPLIEFSQTSFDVRLDAESNSITAITTDADTDAEYFSLQGIRLDNPAKGEIVVKKQGNKVSKEIIH